ncbi:MAG: hypothetical protein ABR954_05915 [Dehalococcoidales bacterium]
MKTDVIEKKLGESTLRHTERLALWKKIKAAWQDDGVIGVEGLLGGMAASLEEKKSQICTRLAKEVGINDGDNQES